MYESDSVPLAPHTLPELFDWHRHNALTLMNIPERKNSFVHFAQKNTILVMDSCSGTGNGCVALRQQFDQMVTASGETFFL